MTRCVNRRELCHKSPSFSGKHVSVRPCSFTTRTERGYRCHLKKKTDFDTSGNNSKAVYCTDFLLSFPIAACLWKKKKNYTLWRCLCNVAKDAWICSPNLKYLVYWFIFYLLSVRRNQYLYVYTLKEKGLFIGPPYYVGFESPRKLTFFDFLYTLKNQKVPLFTHILPLHLHSFFTLATLQQYCHSYGRTLHKT